LRQTMKILLIVLFAQSALSATPACLNGTKVEKKWEEAYSKCVVTGRSVCEELNAAYGIDIDECESSMAPATGRSLTQLCADLNAFFGISVSTCTSSCTYYSTGASCDFTGRKADIAVDRSVCEELNAAYGIDVDECESSFASATGRSLTQLCADLNAFFGISVSTCTSSCTYYSTGASCDFTGRNACPSPKDIIKEARKNLEVERCMMDSMGWFNPKKSSFNKKQIKKDIGSLPDKVSAGITQKSVKKCIKKEMKEMYKKDTMNCLKTYSKKERGMLKKEAYVVATILCLNNPLKEACDNFV